MADDSWQYWLSQATQQLGEAGVEAPQHDARTLLAFHLNCPLNQLHQNFDGTPNELDQFLALVARRAARQPLAHITGTRGFWSLDLTVTPDVLDPRPDTETLIEATLKLCPNKAAPLHLLDIGTGSGAIILSLLSELPNATGVATDVSAKALAIAKMNAAQNQLADRIQFIETSWADGVNGPFDMLISNPPYIASAVIPTLDLEVKEHEPHLALDGGADGLDAYRAIINALPALMKPGGLVAFEIGFDQADSVRALMQATDVRDLATHQDLGRKDRAITGIFQG